MVETDRPSRDDRYGDRDRRRRGLRDSDVPRAAWPVLRSGCVL